MSSRLSGRVAVVTGAGRGIGRSIAKAYAAEGARVALISRTSAELESLAKEVERDCGGGGVALPVTADVRKASDITAAANRVIKTFGRVDILVNNAGVDGTTKPLEEISDVEWDEVMSVNVRGVFLMTRAVLPSMLVRKAGNVINISSGAGVKRKRNAVRSIPYAVSKYALEGLTDGLAVRLRGTGLNVNALRPGLTRTSFQKGWTDEELRKHTNEVGEMHEPEFVNELAVYLAALSPGELTGESISAVEWNQQHLSKGKAGRREGAGQS